MATAANIIDRAMRLIGQVSSGDTSSANEYTDGLAALNALLASWNNERLMCYSMQEESLTFTAAVSRTIGPTGNLVTVRPVEIPRAWVVSSNISYPVEMIEDDAYAAISDKTTTGDRPTRANYKAGMPDGTIYFYPVPNASGTMKLLTRNPLSAFASVATNVSLPPGWERALAFNLAPELAPEFQTSVSVEVAQIARESKAQIKRMNSRPIAATTDLAAVFGDGHGNIRDGDL